MNQTERGPLDPTTAKAIQEIDGGPLPTEGKPLVTDRPTLVTHEHNGRRHVHDTRRPQAHGTEQVPPADQNPHDPHWVPVFEPVLLGSKGGDWALPQPGTALLNGAIVVAAERRWPDEAVVLALTNGMAGDDYVVWRLDLKTGSAYSGEYSSNIHRAADDFISR